MKPKKKEKNLSTKKRALKWQGFIDAYNESTKTKNKKPKTEKTTSGKADADSDLPDLIMDTSEPPAISIAAADNKPPKRNQPDEDGWITVVRRKRKNRVAAPKLFTAPKSLKRLQKSAETKAAIAAANIKAPKKRRRVPIKLD